ncbi:MAG: heme A synthase [Terriglobia bacterium]
MTSAKTGAKNNIGLHRFAVLTAGATFLLIIAGALVTSNDAGLAVPDWPLSYGTWMPPMVGNIVYEHGHRMVATSVGLLTTILAAWLWSKETRRWVRRLGFIALGAVIAQGVLGGITVLYLLPRPLSIGHASLAQGFFGLTVSLAVFTSPGWKKAQPKAEDTAAPPLRHLAAATTLALVVQLILGAAVRHALIGIVPHLVVAAVVVIGVAWTVRHIWQRPATPAPLRRSALALAGLLGVQLALGIGAYLIRIATADAVQPTSPMVTLTVAHVAVGALTLAASLVLTLQCYHHLGRSGQLLPLASTTQKATV